MPYSAIKVANEFLRLAREQSPPRLLTPLQIIKLVYIAHGWGLHFRQGRPLLAEQAQAWQYGPVVPSLYQAVRQFGAGPITARLVGDTDPQELDEWSRDLIRSVFTSYAHFSGTQLSSMTHQPGTPWSNAWTRNGRNAVIPNEEIMAHYGELARARQNVGS